ncbi:type I phosphomannose isomerase catalytic subunit [Candidatus Mycoplasma pogonae]
MLNPFFKKVLWANDNLKRIFNLEQDFYGEAWLISAITNMESTVIIDETTKQNLSVFFANNQTFFNNPHFVSYPNLTKFIDAKDALSIQVHPDDEYAKRYDSLGKDECWYVLKNSGEKFIIGSNTTDKNVIDSAIDKNQTSTILNHMTLIPDDFIYIQAGLIHGIPKNTLVYELQQASDITFRLYDYNRIDLNGELRQVHKQESKDVIKPNLEPRVVKNKQNLVHNHYFNLQKFVINDGQNQQLKFDFNFYWAEIVVIKGQGTLENQQDLKLGDALLWSGHFSEINIKGNLTILINFVQ